jgi:hypothetical protein
MKALAQSKRIVAQWVKKKIVQLSNSFLQQAEKNKKFLPLCLLLNRLITQNINTNYHTVAIEHGAKNLDSRVSATMYVKQCDCLKHILCMAR